MGRDAFLSALELTLVEETQAGGQKRDDRRGLMNFRRERRRRPRFVVVLQETGELVLVIEARVEMLAHRPCMAFPEAIVEPFIVSVVEALLLQRPFQIPVDLGHEEEAGNALTHTLGRRRPEERRTLAPGSFEYVRQDQHGHVAAHAVALSGDLHQLADHRFLRGGVGVVELQCVGPAGEIRITAVGQEQIATLAFDPGVVLRSAGQVEFGALDEIVGMIFDPGMIEPHVIGHEVEHELQAALAEPLAQAGQRGVTPEILDAPCSR